MRTLDRTAVDALRARARREVDDGLLPACAVALALDGEVVVEEAFGDATVDDRFTIYSATKPFVASVVWQLLAEGLSRREIEDRLLQEFDVSVSDLRNEIQALLVRLEAEELVV